MKKTGKCPKCESTNIVSNTEVVSKKGAEYPAHIKARVIRHPHAMIFAKPEESNLKAWICGECGYTELYADDPKYLLDAHHEAHAERKKNGW